MKNQELLQQIGLDWTVNMEPLQTRSGIAIDNKYAVVREDTGSVLGVVGNKYTPIQNDKVLNLVVAGAEKVGLESRIRGGSFDDGAKYYIQVKSDNLILPDNDIVEGYITGVNSHDGSTSLRFGNTNTTISCKNQFNRLFKEHLKTAFRHTASALEQIDAMAWDLERQLELEQQMFAQMKQLAEAPLGDFGTQVTDIILKEIAGMDGADVVEEMSTKKQNIINDLKDSLGGEIAQKGRTLWGAFSGVTHYTTHKVSHREGHNFQKMAGHLLKKENKVFNQLVELVK